MSSSAADPAKSAFSPAAPAGTNCGASPAAAEELDAVGDDLDGLALGAVLSLPLAPLEAAVDRDGPALREVLVAALGLIAPDGDVEVVRLVGPLAGGSVLSPRVDRDPQAADRGAAAGVTQLRVAGQVPHEHDAVDVGCHGFAPSRDEGDQATPRSRRRHRRAWTRPRPAPE